MMCEIVPRPEGKPVTTSKWIYKIKHAANGNIEKHKARFMAKGFYQRERVDYDETFVPVARYTSIRTIISLASAMCWRLHQTDVQTSFLSGVIEEEEVYREQPPSFVVYGKDSHGYKLSRQSVVGFRGSLELGSVTKREREALLSRLNPHEISPMD